MSADYDEYYQTEDLFGEPLPELFELYSKELVPGKLLDLGCGQGRNAIPLAKIGYNVTGLDYSNVGIEQMKNKALVDNLYVTGTVQDMFIFQGYNEFDYILCDSLFHFGKKGKQKEIKLLQSIFDLSKKKAHITICIQNVGKKYNVLKGIITGRSDLEIASEVDSIYTFNDRESNHQSKTKYKIVSVIKQ